MTNLNRRTSSRSQANGNCVEIGEDPCWRKSSRSAGNGACVEVAADTKVHMRDSKDRDGGTLCFSVESWRDFIEAIKEDKI